MEKKRNQLELFLEAWAKEKIKQVTYLSDCIKKILDDEKCIVLYSIWDEEKICLFDDIRWLYNVEYFDYSNRNSFKVKDKDKFKVILSECSEIEVILRIILHEASIENKFDISSFEKYEKRINVLLIYVSLMLGFNFLTKYRTGKSTVTKKNHRKIKESLVQDEYLKWIKQHPNRETVKLVSESRMAQTIKKLVVDHLKAKGIKSISEQTIIDILRNRNKEKLPFYPWENKGVSKM